MSRKTIHINKLDYEVIEDVEWEYALQQDIAFQRNLSIEDVVNFTRYNIMSFKQLALLCGTSESNIRNLTVQRRKKGTGEISSTLTTCNPFPDDNKGKVFIFVDKHCRDYIEKCLQLEKIPDFSKES